MMLLARDLVGVVLLAVLAVVAAVLAGCTLYNNIERGLAESAYEAQGVTPPQPGDTHVQKRRPR